MGQPTAKFLVIKWNNTNHLLLCMYQPVALFLCQLKVKEKNLFAKHADDLKSALLSE